MDMKSWTLGLWRGAHGRARDVALAPNICPRSYGDGFDQGRRNARAIRAGTPIATICRPQA